MGSGPERHALGLEPRALLVARGQGAVGAHDAPPGACGTGDPAARRGRGAVAQLAGVGAAPGSSPTRPEPPAGRPTRPRPKAPAPVKTGGPNPPADPRGRSDLRGPPHLERLAIE